MLLEILTQIEINECLCWLVHAYRHNSRAQHTQRCQQHGLCVTLLFILDALRWFVLVRPDVRNSNAYYSTDFLAQAVLNSQPLIFSVIRFHLC